MLSKQAEHQTVSKIKTYGKNCSSCNPAFVRVEIAQQKYTGINQRQLGTTKPRMQIDVQDFQQRSHDKKQAGNDENGAHFLDKEGDRKSTRLNSSHVAISYAIFCLKKKNTEAR